MPDFPKGARVRIDQCEGEVVGNDQRVVLVRIPGICDAGRFNPKFVHLVDEAAAGPGVVEYSPTLDELSGPECGKPGSDGCDGTCSACTPEGED